MCHGILLLLCLSFFKKDRICGSLPYYRGGVQAIACLKESAFVGSLFRLSAIEPLCGWGASYRLLFVGPLRDFVAVALPHRQGALSRIA